MSLVRLENVTKRFGAELVLDGVNLRVEETDRIGLIGRNGTGKSTIFRLITGELDPDGGTVERMRTARVACLQQLPRVDPKASVHDVVMESFADLRRLERQLQDMEERLAAGEDALLAEYSTLQDQFQVRGGYEFRARVKRVLTGLGFHEDEFGLHLHALSGGQRTRLMLALVLLQDADLLLLDEPENHLDIAAREWLETFLGDWPRAFVAISHDRRILDAAAQRIVEVERGGVSGFTGNYEAFHQHKLVAVEQQREAYKRQQTFIEKEQRWIERFRYKNTKASQVQSRIKRLEKLERLEPPLSDAPPPRLALGEVVRSGQVVLDVREASMAYGDLVLYHDLTFQVERGERVAIIGANGTGKTTLLRQMAGRLPGAGGIAKAGHKVQLGFYEQHHENLHPDADIFTEVRNARPDMSPEEVRSFMGRFLFTGEDVFKPIGALSGGELSRVAIAKLVLGEANTLLLDEPTNHLDIASREALETALIGYPGTIVLVTHDRALVDKLATKLIIIERGHATVFDGNYARYRRKQAEDNVREEATLADAMRIRAQRARARRARSKEEQAASRRKRRALEQLEEQIAAMEETITDLEAESAALDPTDFARARELRENHDGLKNDLTELYVEWERLSEELASD